MRLDLRNSEDIGKTPDLVWVDVNLIKVDKNYQREENAKHVDNIVKHFNWRKFQPVTLAQRPDGSFNVVDGQHRVAAAKLHPRVIDIPALIFESSGEIVDEANIFVEVNSNRRGITPIEKHIAAVAAQKPESLGLNAALAAVGCQVADYKGHKGGNVTNAVAACMGAIRKNGEDSFKSAIRTLRQAWPTDIDVLRAGLINSLSTLYNHNQEMDEFHMAVELKKHGMAETFNLSRALIKMGGGNMSSLMQVMVNLYNQTAPNNRQIRKP